MSIKYDSSDFLYYDLWPVENQSSDPITVLIPHSNRDALACVLANKLSHYLPRAHPKSSAFSIVFVEQVDRTPGDFYCKGLSWNVGIRYLIRTKGNDNEQVVLQDVDIVPVQNVDYTTPHAGTTDIWFGNTGGMKTRLGALRRANGYTMIAKGWGVEDVACWKRLERRANEKIRHWPTFLRTTSGRTKKTPPVFVNLEWGADVVGDELKEKQEWYWGPDKDVVHMVSQADPRFGHSPVDVPVKTTDWYDDTQTKRNQRMNKLIEAASEEDFERLIAADGFSALCDEGVRVQLFAERFPQAVLNNSVNVVNVKFDSQKVLGKTVKSLIDSDIVGWYIKEEEQPES